MKNFSSPSNHRHPPPAGGFRPHRSQNHNYYQNNQHHHPRPNFQTPNTQYYRRYPPPPPAAVAPQNPRPNFTIQLLHDPFSSSSSLPNNLHTLITQLDPSPQKFQVYTTGRIAASLYFQEWTHTRSSVLSLWRSRLDGSLNLLPNLVSSVLLPSDLVELEQNLNTLFSNHIKGLMEGGLVKKWQKKIDEKSDEIAGISGQMGKRHCSIGGFYELNDKKKALIAERFIISKRLKEFKRGLKSLLGCLERAEVENEGKEEAVEVFQVDGEIDWKRIHRLILRECRRLEDGLPIYAYRQDILTRIHGDQVKNSFSF